MSFSDKSQVVSLKGVIKIAYSPKFLDASDLNHLSHLWSRSLIFPSYHHFLWLNSYPPQRQFFFAAPARSSSPLPKVTAEQRLPPAAPTAMRRKRRGTKRDSAWGADQKNCFFRNYGYQWFDINH